MVVSVIEGVTETKLTVPLLTSSLTDGVLMDNDDKTSLLIKGPPKSIRNIMNYHCVSKY